MITTDSTDVALCRERDEEWLMDALDTVQEMRANGGDLELIFPRALHWHQQRLLTWFLHDMRQFGYTMRSSHDNAGRITRVQLLEQ